MREAAPLLLLTLLATLLRPACASSAFSVRQHGGHSDNPNAAPESIADATLHCYDHALLGDASVQAHRIPTVVQAQTGVVHANAASFRFPVSHVEWLHLVSLEIVQLELDAVSSDVCNEAQRVSGDGLRLVWSDSASWVHFAELPVPCDAEAMRVSVSLNGDSDWGHVPHGESTSSSHVYRPRGGLESMDAVVERLNRQHKSHPDMLQHFSLTVYLRSDSLAPVRALVVRKCLVEPAQPLALVGMVSAEGARVAGIDSLLAAQLQSVPVALTDDTHVPLLVALRSCAWEEQDSGSCFVDVGWFNGGDSNVLAATCKQGNCLQPRWVRDYTRMPRVFAPGLHRNHTRIVWTCHGALPGEWNTLRWTLGTSVVQVDHTTPLCRDVYEPYALTDNTYMPALQRYRVSDSALVLHAAAPLVPGDNVDYGNPAVAQLNYLLNSECVHSSAACDDADDSGSVFAVLWIFVLIDVAIVFVMVFVFEQQDPRLVGLVCLAVDAALFGLVAYNFVLAPRLNAPNDFETPDNLLGLDGSEGTNALQPGGAVPNV